MNGPVNNTLINEALPLNKNIKLDTKQYNVAETICVFLPHHITETDASSEHQVHLVQPKEKMVDINSDIPKDPLAIEEINLVESKNIKVEIEVDSEISLNNEVLPHLNLKMETNELEINDLHTVKTEEVMEFSAGHQINLVHLKEEPLDIMNGGIEKDPLAIEDTNKSENLKVENEVVTIDKGIIKGSTNHCITCKCVNNSVHDGIIKKKSSECKCAYGDVTTEESLVKNISSENKFIQKGKKLVCEYCDGRFGCKCYLKRHINFHGKKKKNNSNVCEKSLIRDSALKTHLTTHNEEENYVCNFCQKSFIRKDTLKTHINFHTKEKNYACYVCQKVFYQPSDLKKHINSHTKEKTYVCNFCQKVLTCSSRLKAHINIHTKEKNYICNICQKSFNHKNTLRTHINLHTKEKSSSGLKTHLNIHNKEKNCICNFCQKSFYRKDSLMKHINLHTKEKIYVCNVCQKDFYHPSDLKKHLKIHKKEKNYI